MSPERCEWIDDPEIGLWHLPMCWGAVVGGPECCYCEPDDSLIPASTDQRLQRIERLLAKLVSAKDQTND